MKKIISVLLSVFLSMTLVACGDSKEGKPVESNGKINLVTSFYGMKALAEEIGGDKVEIYNITPEGSEPHDFEPKAKDIKLIENGDIFIYNGAGMEHWVEKTLKTISNKDLIVVEASKNVELIEGEGGKQDPHTWLGLTSSKIEANNIKNALIEKDATNKEYYEKNYNKFIEKIESIEKDYSEKYKELRNRDFITGHETFGYLCKDLGIVQKSIEGLFAEGEPSPKQLEELINYCKKNNVKIIFVEELISPELSDTLAREIDGSTVKIYTLHSSEDNKSFSEALRYNVETIYEVLSKM